MPPINRAPFEQTKQFTNSLGTTPVVDFGGLSDLMFYFPAGYSSTAADIYAYDPGSATFIDTGLNLTVPALPGTVQLPVGLFPATRLKFVTDQDDSAKTVGITGK